MLSSKRLRSSPGMIAKSSEAHIDRLRKWSLPIVNRVEGHLQINRLVPPKMWIGCECETIADDHPHTVTRQSPARALHHRRRHVHLADHAP